MGLPNPEQIDIHIIAQQLQEVVKKLDKLTDAINEQTKTNHANDLATQKLGLQMANFIDSLKEKNEAISRAHKRLDEHEVHHEDKLESRLVKLEHFSTQTKTYGLIAVAVVTPAISIIINKLLN